MEKLDLRKLWSCDFLTENGTNIRCHQHVRFNSRPPFHVVVGDRAFKKMWEMNDRLIYVEVDIVNLSSQVDLSDRRCPNE